MSTFNPAYFTIKQLAEYTSAEVNDAGGFVRSCVHLGLLEYLGPAPKTEETKGKAPGVYRFKQDDNGMTLARVVDLATKAKARS